jgi:hypothetical protein
MLKKNKNSRLIYGLDRSALRDKEPQIDQRSEAWAATSAPPKT